MGSYFVKRITRALLTIIGVSIIVFIALRAIGDPVMHLVAEDASEAEITRVRAELGLDKPLYVQYGRYVRQAITGNFGESLRYRRPAFQLVLQRLPATVELTFTAFFFSTVLGVLMGVWGALKRGTWIDTTLRLIAVLGQSAPSFWIGTLAILIFGVHLHWLPTSGRLGMESLILPAATLALFSLASVVRLTRSAMLETTSAEYIKFLRSKGLPEHLIVWKHALRNALVPIAAALGIQHGHLVGGAIIIEVVFNWPGIGRLMVEALLNNDFAVIQASVLLIATSIVLVNAAVDMSLGLIDPRVRYA
jgi:peptide/nickel transport system permease protein